MAKGKWGSDSNAQVLRDDIEDEILNRVDSSRGGRAKWEVTVAKLWPFGLPDAPLAVEDVRVEDLLEMSIEERRERIKPLSIREQRRLQSLMQMAEVSE